MGKREIIVRGERGARTVLRLVLLIAVLVVAVVALVLWHPWTRIHTVALPPVRASKGGPGSSSYSRLIRAGPQWAMLRKNETALDAARLDSFPKG